MAALDVNATTVRMGGLPLSVKLSLYTAKVRSKALDKKENRTLRQMLQTGQRPSLAAMLWIFGLLPLSVVCKIRMLKFCAKVLSMSDDCMEKKAVCELKAEFLEFRIGWCFRERVFDGTVLDQHVRGIFTPNALRCFSG